MNRQTEPYPRRKLNHRTTPWLLLVLVSFGVAGWGWPTTGESSLAAYLGDPLYYQSIRSLPDWAADPVQRLIDDPAYQIVAAVADLNQDGIGEIIVAPAPRTHDLFIPDTALRVLMRTTNSSWRVVSSQLSCRPRELGSFMTRGYWDLPCVTRQRRSVLRWTGEEYVTPLGSVTDAFPNPPSGRGPVDQVFR